MIGGGGVEAFRRISIRGLFNEGDFELEFDNKTVTTDTARCDGTDLDSLRIIYGRNGIGKTTALKMIKFLLEGDMISLLSIPFQSIEIERWEPWDPPTTEKIPGGVSGMQIHSADDGIDPTFTHAFNYMKILTNEFYEGWESTAKGTISDAQKRKIEKFLAEDSNKGLRDEIGLQSEPGSYEVHLSYGHSHILKIEREILRDEIIFSAEYIQNRSPQKNEKDVFSSIANLLRIL